MHAFPHCACSACEASRASLDAALVRLAALRRRVDRRSIGSFPVRLLPALCVVTAGFERADGPAMSEALDEVEAFLAEAGA